MSPTEEYTSSAYAHIPVPTETHVSVRARNAHGLDGAGKRLDDRSLSCGVTPREGELREVHLARMRIETARRRFPSLPNRHSYVDYIYGYFYVSTRAGRTRAFALRYLEGLLGHVLYP